MNIHHNVILLLFFANEVQSIKVNVQSVWVPFVQNERNTLYQRDIIHSLIFDKDRVFFFPGRFFSPSIFCQCFHRHSRQALQLEQLEHTFSFFSIIVLPSWLSALIWRHFGIFSEIIWSQSQALKLSFNTCDEPFQFWWILWFFRCCKKKIYSKYDFANLILDTYYYAEWFKE